MKTFQTFLMEADELYKNPKIVPDTKLLDFIKQNCQESLRIMSKAGRGWLKRGFAVPVIDPKASKTSFYTRLMPNSRAFVLDSPTGRLPKNTSPVLHNLFIDLIANSTPNYNGVNRDNSFFLAATDSTAGIYGTVHLAIPLDGFKYLYSPDIRDLYTTFTNSSSEFLRAVFPHYAEFREFMQPFEHKMVNGVLVYPYGGHVWLEFFDRAKADKEEAKRVAKDRWIGSFLKKNKMTLDELFRIDYNSFRLFANYQTTDLEEAIRNNREIMVTGKVLFVPQTNKVIWNKFPDDLIVP